MLPEPKLVPLPKEMVDPDGSADKLGLEAPDVQGDAAVWSSFPKFPNAEPDDSILFAVANGDCVVLAKLEKPELFCWFAMFMNGED